MQNRRAFLASLAALALAVGLIPATVTLAQGAAGPAEDGVELSPRALDFGRVVEAALEAHSLALFGIEAPLPASAPATAPPYRGPEQAAGDQLLAAPGLSVRYLTRQAGNRTDMMVPFPPAEPTHLVTCVEGRREALGVHPDGSPRYNPSVQRIDLATGMVVTLLRGMHHCDGIRATPWGTILVTEESADGGAYEILAPLQVQEHTVVDRASGEVRTPQGTPATRVAKRPALPTMAWEGLAVLPSGVVVGGDELRPGSGTPDADGGTIYKLIPDAPWGGGPAITGLAASPLVSGRVYALRVSCLPGREQFGQGCEVGEAGWVEVAAATARPDADALGATGYYRPEDLHQDPLYTPPPESPSAVRFCWANTGNEANRHYGEVLCAVDPEPASAASRAVVSRFLEGGLELNSLDNLAFQPRTGHLWVVEDHVNGDLFACLPDGADQDLRSDGCIRVLSVKDSSAEPTGFVFHPDGATAYLSIQHSNDQRMPLFDGYPTDDVLVISGFRNLAYRRRP